MSILGGETYNDQSKEYAAFAKESFSWQHIERPGLDDYLSGYYERGQDIQILDIGCGSGRVIEHLIKRGIPAGNLTGLDPSINMLDIAAQNLPQDISLVMNKAAKMPFADESFHLVIATMVLHAMDDQEASATMGRVSEVLKPGGEFFFIDNDPTAEAEENGLNHWVTKRSPWDTNLQVFKHDVDRLLETVAPSHGLECVRSGRLEIDEAGRTADAEEYERYSTGSFRRAALLRKVSDQEI